MNLILDTARKIARERERQETATEKAAAARRAREIGGAKGFLRVATKDGLRLYDMQSQDPDGLLPNA